MDDRQLLGTIIPTLPADAPQFIELVSRAISGELEARAVRGLFVVRIDNWFDHKWLYYSGKAAYDPDTALDEFHRKGRQSWFPPFTPNRVIAQECFRIDQYGSYVLEEDGRIHSPAKARSSTNLLNRMTTHNNSCLFVWFSSNTLANRRGSLMVYRAIGKIITSWYSSFSFDGDWRVAQTKGISRQNLLGWLTPRTRNPVSFPSATSS
jgi:hypothetical protein